MGGEIEGRGEGDLLVEGIVDRVEVGGGEEKP